MSNCKKCGAEYIYFGKYLRCPNCYNKYEHKCIVCGVYFKTHKKIQNCCSKKCQYIEFSKNMKGRIAHNYIGVTNKDGKHKNISIGNGKRVSYHRWLMEQHLGYKIDKDLVVHHINFNAEDNRIENLQILTRAEHARLHMEKRLSG